VGCHSRGSLGCSVLTHLHLRSDFGNFKSSVRWPGRLLPQWPHCVQGLPGYYSASRLRMGPRLPQAWQFPGHQSTFSCLSGSAVSHWVHEVGLLARIALHISSGCFWVVSHQQNLSKYLEAFLASLCYSILHMTLFSKCLSLLFFFFAVLGFELRTSCLQDRHSTGTWATTPAHRQYYFRIF
jgi:hypothetical protein